MHVASSCKDASFTLKKKKWNVVDYLIISSAHLTDWLHLQVGICNMSDVPWIKLSNCRHTSWLLAGFIFVSKLAVWYYYVTSFSWPYGMGFDTIFQAWRLDGSQDLPKLLKDASLDFNTSFWKKKKHPSKWEKKKTTTTTKRNLFTIHETEKQNCLYQRPRPHFI